MPMKKLIVTCLALALFASMGCGNKPDNDKEAATTEAGPVKLVMLTDPVDGSKIGDVDDVKYSFVYNKIEYRFNSKENYEAFKKDPEKYLTK
jgi:YHS domain-containing protein